MILTASYFENRNPTFFEKCPLCGDKTITLANTLRGEEDEGIDAACYSKKHNAGFEVSINFAKYYIVALRTKKFSINYYIYPKTISIHTNSIFEFTDLNVDFESFPFRDVTDEEIQNYLVFA